MSTDCFFKQRFAPAMNRRLLRSCVAPAFLVWSLIAAEALAQRAIVPRTQADIVADLVSGDYETMVRGLMGYLHLSVDERRSECP